jgi:hypothetical protein
MDDPQAFISRAQQAYQRGDSATAGQLFEQAAALVPEDDAETAERINTSVALFFVVIEDDAKAEHYFRRGLRFLKASLKHPECREVATYMLHLADAVRRQGREQEAAELEAESERIWPGA